MDIVGLGSLAMDVLIQVNSLPREDGFCVIRKRTLRPGGSGTNVIVQAARLSAACGYVAQVGDDTCGRQIIASLHEEKVDTSAMAVKEGGTSLNTEIVVDDSGNKFIMLEMGDCFLSFEQRQVDVSYVTRAKVFYTDLIPGEPAVLALREAKGRKLQTAFNMQVDLPTMEGFGISRQTILDSLRYVDLFAPCRAGLFQLCGTEDLDTCLARIREHFHGTLLVTLGSSGAVAFGADGGRFEQPAFPVTVVDTTGAGDSFMGGMLYSYLLHGMPLERSIRFSAACAAITCTHIGARSGPDGAEVRSFLERSA